MRRFEMPEVAEKQLELGDYVSVYVPGLNGDQESNANAFVMQDHREAFLQRIQKQRGKLIDVRIRSAA